MALHRATLETEPSEIHGMFCAMLCTHPASSPDKLLDEEVFSHLPESDELSECRQMLYQLWNETRDQIGSSDSNLYLLLPDDDASISDRGRALASWCEGFLYIVGVAGEGIQARFSDEAREFIADMAEFTMVDLDLEESQEIEFAFVEVTEYARIGTMMLYQDLVLDNPENVVSGMVTQH